MFFLPRKKTYKGKLHVLGSSIGNSGDEYRTYSLIRVGKQDMHNVIVSREFDKYLILDEEIEISLIGASITSLVFLIVGAILMVAGEMSDVEAMFVSGAIILIISMVLLFKSLTLAGHEVCSVKTAQAIARVAPLVSEDVQPNIGLSEEPQVEIKSPPQAMTRPVPDFPPAIRSRVVASERLVCSNCASEAWVAPETRITCSPCGLEMRA
jgi:hypothetical protein